MGSARRKLRWVADELWVIDKAGRVKRQINPLATLAQAIIRGLPTWQHVRKMAPYFPGVVMGFVEQWKQSRRDKAQDEAWRALELANAPRLLEAVKSGASINVPDGAGFSLALRAIQQGHYPLLSALDKSGADWNLPLPDGRTALHLAVESSQSLWVKAMLDRGVDTERSSIMGLTPLHLAARIGSGQIIRMLHAAGASWQAKDKQGLNPLEVLQKMHPALHSTWDRVVRGD